MQLLSLFSLIFLSSVSFVATAPACFNKEIRINDLNSLPPPQKSVSYVLLGVGTQNYTCTNASLYTSAGAVATLIDVARLSNKPNFSNLTALAYDIWNKTNEPTPVFDGISKNGKIFGSHYFVNNNNTLSPLWDATSGHFKGNSDAFMLAAKAAGVAAPTSKSDVDWLYLKRVNGSLADEVYRMDTRGGQPPASCTDEGSSTTVKYTALYYLTGVNLTRY